MSRFETVGKRERRKNGGASKGRSRLRTATGAMADVDSQRAWERGLEADGAALTRGVHYEYFRRASGRLGAEQLEAA